MIIKVKAYFARDLCRLMRGNTYPYKVMFIYLVICNSLLKDMSTRRQIFH